MTNTALKHAPSVMENAKRGLKLQKDAATIVTEQEAIKAFFRNYADGEKFTVTVAGVGEVTVKAPAAASSGQSTVFDEAAFNALPRVTRDQLIARGVVAYQDWSKPASKAAVTFTLNK